MTTMLLLAAVVVLAVALAVAIVALVRGGGRHDDAAVLGDQIEDAAHAQALAVERLERELRGEIVENARGSRTELAGSFSQLQQTLATQLTSAGSLVSSVTAAWPWGSPPTPRRNPAAPAPAPIRLGGMASRFRP